MLCDFYFGRAQPGIAQSLIRLATFFFLCLRSHLAHNSKAAPFRLKYHTSGFACRDADSAPARLPWFDGLPTVSAVWLIAHLDFKSEPSGTCRYRGEAAPPPARVRRMARLARYLLPTLTHSDWADFVERRLASYRLFRKKADCVRSGKLGATHATPSGTGPQAMCSAAVVSCSPQSKRIALRDRAPLAMIIHQLPQWM